MKIDVFAKRRRQYTIFFIIMAVLTYGAIILTDYDVVKGFTSFPRAIQWMFNNLYPDAESLEKLPDILEKLLDTILISIAAAVVSAVFALLFALLGSETTKVNSFFKYLSRFIASVFRNIPIVAWAMILLFSFGQSDLTGYFALFFVSFGFLTRAFTEAIDEASQSSVEALNATGATYFQIIFQAVIPSVITQIISWILFMIETNIRSSALVGLLTGTGIGFKFTLYYRSLNYQAASLVVITLVIAILAIEMMSNYVRRMIL